MPERITVETIERTLTQPVVWDQIVKYGLPTYALKRRERDDVRFATILIQESDKRAETILRRKFTAISGSPIEIYRNEDFASKLHDGWYVFAIFADRAYRAYLGQMLGNVAGLFNQHEEITAFPLCVMQTEINSDGIGAEIYRFTGPFSGVQVANKSGALYLRNECLGEQKQPLKLEPALGAFMQQNFQLPFIPQKILNAGGRTLLVADFSGLEYTVQ